MKLNVLFFVLVGFVTISVADAGSALIWHSTDAGGGVSTGGGIVLTGTIGQPDAARLSGGDVVLVGGFWGGASLLQAEDLPTLRLSPVSANELIIYWETTDGTEILEHTACLSSGEWMAVPGDVASVGNERRVHVSMDASIRFFRLRKAHP